ncbi:MAG: minC [Gammaproteobacteria bacterium]|jgi:septum site-determining protein MinC|nr:minC [Gammaproteobacteria bacterium]
MSTITTSRSHAFQLKGGPVTLTTLNLQTANLPEIILQLTATVAQSPTFFANAPVIIDSNQLSADMTLDLDQLNQALRKHGLIPVGIRSNNESLRTTANLIGLAIFPSEQASTKQSTTPQSAPTTKPLTYQSTKTITQPIRSGQQIYAKDGDLLILSSVSPGAEVLADGNIYVYGTLRGRALAGINGNKEARIFCQALEAELISIAGHYQISENLKKPAAEGIIHIFLENDHLCIGAL